MDWWRWRQYATQHDIAVVEAETPHAVLGCVVGERRIVVASWLPWEARSLIAWHELGHLSLHVGAADDWRRCPGGSGLLARFEYQAWRFALTYPHWDGEALLAALTMLQHMGRFPHALQTALMAQYGL